MSKVDLRKVVNLNFTMENKTESTWNIPLLVEFIPDIVTVKQFVANTTTNTGDPLQFASNLITDTVLFSFVDVKNTVQINHLEVIFTLKKSVNGTFLFQVQQAPTNISANSGIGPGPAVNDIDGTLQIMLEFIKYKD